MIYYGDEIAMDGGRDPDNRRDFRDAATEEESAVLKHVRELLALRSKIPALRTGRLRNLAAGVDYYVYERVSETERVVVALGNPPEEYKRGIEVFPLAAPAKRQ